jgi:prepilin-type processing-associated H-X9-DG protein
MVLAETASSPLQGYNSPNDTANNGYSGWRFDHRNHTAMNILFMDGHVDTMVYKQFLTPPGTDPDLESGRPPGYHSFWFGRPDSLDIYFVGNHP